MHDYSIPARRVQSRKKAPERPLQRPGEIVANEGPCRRACHTAEHPHEIARIRVAGLLGHLLDGQAPGQQRLGAFQTLGRDEFQRRLAGETLEDAPELRLAQPALARQRPRVVQDWKGNICEIENIYTPEYLLNAIDFVTRRWIKCPVETRADWADMKRRYDADAPERLPADPAAAGKALEHRDTFLELHFSGPFWQVREWVGFETLCTLFYDDPAFVGEMIAFWSDHVARLLERALAVVKPDCVHLSEDMAYKGCSMISPAMAREYLLPVWTRWGDIVRKAGVPLYGMDSDGFIGELIPLWIEAGINVCDPIEVAAGNDIVAFRRTFGRDMAYRGGVDKRAMAKGGAALRAEIDRLRPVVEDGGYVPGCDHGVPPDVSWPNYVETVRLLAQICGW